MITFQTRYPESSDRLNLASTVIGFDIDSKILIIQYNMDHYDEHEIRSTLDRHIFKNSQYIEVETNGSKYSILVTPMIRRHISDKLDEVEYTIHSYVEERL
jgi:hypothetical protein